MRSLVTVFVLFLGLVGFSQNFEQTDDYYITEIDTTTKRAYWNKFPQEDRSLPIFLKDKDNNTLLELSVNLMSYDETSVSVLKVNDLHNIKEIVKVSSTHTACCSITISHYLGVTKDGTIIKLPQIENSHCDGSEPWTAYIFPNQEFGEKNKIIMGEYIYNIESKKTSLAVEKRYVWNTKTLQLEAIKNTLATH